MRAQSEGTLFFFVSGTSSSKLAPKRAFCESIKATLFFLSVVQNAGSWRRGWEHMSVRRFSESILREHTSRIFSSCDISCKDTWIFKWEHIGRARKVSLILSYLLRCLRAQSFTFGVWNNAHELYEYGIESILWEHKKTGFIWMSLFHSSRFLWSYLITKYPLSSNYWGTVMGIFSTNRTYMDHQK